MRRSPLPPQLALIAALALACTPHRDEAPPWTDAHTRASATAREQATIEVLAAWPERSAFEIERELLIPLEQALRDTPKLLRMHSSARAGHATIVLTLDAHADVERSRVSVRDRLAATAASLPDAVRPLLGPDLAPPASALIFALSSSAVDSMQLHRIAEDLGEALRPLPGVGEVATCGAHESHVVVALDPARLSATRLSPAEIVETLTTSLHDPPSAPLGVIRAAGLRDLDDLMATIVIPGKHPTRLRDLASISVEPRRRACEAVRAGGGLAVVGLVRARRGADLGAVYAAVRAQLATHSAEFAARGLTLDVPDAAPLRLALDLRSSSDPAETLGHASRAIGDALAAAGPSFADRLALVQATTSAQHGAQVEGELLLASTGLDPAQQDALEQRLDALPTLRVRGWLDDPGVWRFRISGDDLELGRRLAHEAAELAAKLPGVLRAAPLDDLQPRLVLALKRERLASLGLGANDLLIALATVLDGAPAGRVQMQRTSMPVIVHVGADPRDRSAQRTVIPALELPLPDGGTTRLDELVDLHTELEPTTITRVDGRRGVTVELRVHASTPALRPALQQTLAASLALPPGYTLTWDPQHE